MKKKITYEQPLNERMRNLLRLEQLFLGIAYRLKAPATWDSRAVMDYLVEMLEFLAVRNELKAELIKDLERHLQVLERWQMMPKVDLERIGQLLDNIKQVLNKLGTNEQTLGTELTSHQLINAIRQRHSIVGGTCQFDLPNYHYWLQRHPKQRQQEVNQWLAPLEPLREAIDLNLYLIRNNAVTSQEIAPAGFFQANLDVNAAYQLVQINLPLEHPCYPEISGSKQRLTVRFFEQPNLEERSLLTEQDVNFELCCCMI